MSKPPIVEDGQFDDAPTDRHPEDFRQGYDHMDKTPMEQSEVSSEDDDDFHSEESDDNFARAEDEDWEIAEKGRRSGPTPLGFPLF